GLEYLTMIHHDVPLFLKGDPGRLRQILINLVGNAIKFTQNGELIVNIAMENEDSSKATIRFSVKDTGIGIPKKRFKTLFKSFSQADSSTTRKYGGTGLGLTISKQLCELMGGQIGVISKEGKGSEFWFTAIFKKQSEIKGKQILIKDDSKTNQRVLEKQYTVSENQNLKFKILLAEDNEINQMVALATLSKLGYIADPVYNGKQAVQALEKTRYDIVLMDCQMPQMDGYQATKQIRNPQSRVIDHKVPVIALTAHATKGDGDKCLKAGMDDYMTKPFQPSLLADMLKKWLPKHNSSSRNENKSPPLEKEQVKEEILDWTGFLDRIMNDEDLAKDIFNEFLNETPKRIDKIHKGIDKDDTLVIKREAHTLKGSSANVGAIGLQNIAYQIEISASDEDLKKAASFFPKLEKQFIILKEVFHENINS
ncbi:MAG: response regulator, partial [Desulfobacula sp.]|uniref:ATP-binding protein n=1 Tax=Desulfobacula sp. TaxID=2593537 RepID=UPI0025B87532